MQSPKEQLLMLKEQIRKVESALGVCRQLNHDPNTFMSFRNDLIFMERYLLEAANQLGLGKIPPFALRQFTPAEIEELQANLRHWDSLVAERLASLAR